MSTPLANLTNKRKSDTDAGPLPKKARTTTDPKSLVGSILLSPTGFVLPEGDDATRELLLKLATYARSLEQGAGKPAAAVKTKEQIEAAAEKVRKAALSGIRKQMTWKPSCKTGGAKFSYDGVCADPDVFAAVMGSATELKWKMKKVPKDEMETLLGGDLTASVRYDELVIKGDDINVRWNPSEGTFKMSGTYGRNR